MSVSQSSFLDSGTVEENSMGKVSWIEHIGKLTSKGLRHLLNPPYPSIEFQSCGLWQLLTECLHVVSKHLVSQVQTTNQRERAVHVGLPLA